MKTLKGARLILGADGDFCAVLFEEGTSWAYWYTWNPEKGTFSLSFGSSEWEGLFKSTALIRDYLDLVLRELISYKNKVDALLG